MNNDIRLIESGMRRAISDINKADQRSKFFAQYKDRENFIKERLSYEHWIEVKKEANQRFKILKETREKLIKDGKNA